MSAAVLKDLMQREGLSKRAAAALTQLVLDAIQSELENNGKFVIQGIGVIEVVRNERKLLSSHLNCNRLTPTPVRIRFRTSRRLKQRLIDAYADRTDQTSPIGTPCG